MIPGLRTLKNLLETALAPVGSTMYIYGGGWNEADDGAGEDAVSIGVAPQWRDFFSLQKANYDFHHHHDRRDGLDCSGYVGWVLYNVFRKESGGEGYVLPSAEMAKTFAAYGWGTYLPAKEVGDYCPGDLMSSKERHVYIVLGACADGSVLLLHASPPGVMLSGTVTPAGETESNAVSLAEYYLKTYYPAWYEKFPACGRGLSYLTEYDQLRWDLGGVLKDPEGYRFLPPPLLLADLFKNKKYSLVEPDIVHDKRPYLW
ncbi:MAG TPA: hypothetical protein PKD52_09770 [Clostridiales bacterium]|nr:hypothetical protein [Clostridiales bacterium]